MQMEHLYHTPSHQGSGNTVEVGSGNHKSQSSGRTEAKQSLLDMTGLESTWVHCNWVCLLETCMRSNLSTFQHRLGRGTQATTHNKALDSNRWLTAEGELVFPREEPLIGYLILSGQSWNHTHTSNTEWTWHIMFIYLCYIVTKIIIKEKTTWIRETVRGQQEDWRERSWEGLGGEKGK